MPSASSSRNLEIARRDLLDLGLRNTLLNYRPLRSRGIEVVDEIPREVFRILVAEEKAMTFLPGAIADSAGNAIGAAAGLEQPGDERGIAPRHTDSRLQTAYTSAQLQSRLLATYHAARTAMEEQGVNTLFLALGMLTWREEDNAEKFCRAPLILVPVELERSDARDRFRLRYTGEELGDNVSLAEKLKQNFGVKSFPTLPEADDLDVDLYLAQVQQAVSGRGGWTVDAGAVSVGFFSFAKFLMYRDLDPSTWPVPGSILEHPILTSLLGEAALPASPSNYREDCLLEDQLGTRELLHVVDADSSQSLAILDSIDGHTMVIQGPPGTGKSQTIVNLIAGAVAAGKRVLFVSEKMAALDVVKRRLDQVRLGTACLELHSNRTNKRTIIEELRRSVLRQTVTGPAKAELSLLGDYRERLNTYAKAVNEPVGSTGENPCSAYARVLAAQESLSGYHAPELCLDTAGLWSFEETARRLHLVVQLQDRVSCSGVPNRHPFWGSRLAVLLPADRDEIRNLCVAAASAGQLFQNAACVLAQMFHADLPASPADAASLTRNAQYLMEAPPLAGCDLRAEVWSQREPEIRRGLSAGRRHRDLHLRFDAALRPEAWSKDVSEIRQDIADLGNRWWRVFSGRWRRAQRSLASLSSGPTPREPERQLTLLDAITEAASCAQRVSHSSSFLSALFGLSWKELDSDWDLLDAQANWIMAAPAWCADAQRIAVDKPKGRAQIGQVESSRKEFESAVSRWRQRLQMDESPASETFGSGNARWQQQNARIDELRGLVAFNQIAAECRREGLDTVIEIASSWELAGTMLAALYNRSRALAVLRRAFQERPALAGFDGTRHGSAVLEFRRLDLLQIEYNRALLASRHAQSLPSGGGAGEIGILWREFEKRSRFLPIRSLMAKAGHAVQSIKPVFMMSPLSIANYLPPEALTFDLIIFDEASQVRPVDALGAIVRGKQVVVVGDSRQLPPTSFFDSLTGAEEAEQDEETTNAADIESILGLFCARGAHQRMLRWHYRSRHESLIAVSNHLFYDDRLVVFPSPDRGRRELGLVYRHIENAAYDRSRTRTNPTEAAAVAAAVMGHAREQMRYPGERRNTLGVAAFSIAQMDAILSQVEYLRRQDPSCEEFFSNQQPERFFVKSLENVQGDERDVIFISIGYGRTAEGYLAMSFGPLNRTGGERRLNVLVSRARKRCEVFTSLTPDDIDLAKTNSAGVAALKTFLHYAKTGQMDIPHRTDRLPDSQFEEQVFQKLTGLGHTVHAQVGSAGFFLDMAVVDSANPGRYVLGIECDGARYHSACSARDRDRLRQAVLEGLGWRIHRIWSTDWFHNPDQELRKVVQAIETAQSAISTPPPAPPPPAPLPPVPLEVPEPRAAETSPGNPSTCHYKCAEVQVHLGDAEIHAIERARLAAFLQTVVTVESPIHWTEAVRRVLNGAGIQRMGSRIQQAFEEAIRIGVSRGLFVRNGDFLWSPEMREPPMRDRSNLPASSRKPELIAPEEIRQAIVTVVRDSCGMIPDEIPAAVCRVLGFSRVTDDLVSAICPHRDALVQDGRMVRQGDNLVIRA
ncbi:MAG TPA: DUF3320 domain-containing protein [Bryobacteraceae bacterium]|nr:DUF3320 domain-containing protein [Bryobacteraceae bacterium]